MTSAEIIDLARDQTHVSSTQFSDAQVLKYLNIIKDNFFSYIITAISEDYEWDTNHSDLVIGQSEYVLPAMASDTAGLKKVSSVSISYTGDTHEDGTLKYIKAKEIKPNNLRYEWGYYTNNQNRNNPIYYIADKSIFIAPHPDSAITNGVLVKGIKKIVNYTVSTAEEDMKIPVDHHSILVQGILPFIYKAQGKIAESNAEKQEYIRQRQQASLEMADRSKDPYYLKYPGETSTDIYSDEYLTLNNY